MTTFAQYAEQYERAVVPLRKPATQRSVLAHVRALRARFDGRRVQDLTNSAIQSYVTELSPSLKSASIRNRLATLRAILKQAEKDGRIHSLPQPELPKTFKTPQDCLTVAEMRALLAGGNLLYAVLAETGARIGEVLGLSPLDVDVFNRTLSINRSLFLSTLGTPKTANAVRAVSLSSSVSERLRAHLDGRATGYVFQSDDCRPVMQNTILRAFHRDLRAVGLKPMGFHAWRRSNITALAADLNCPEEIIAQRVGHSHRGITLGRYLQRRLDDRPWAERLSDLLF